MPYIELEIDLSDFDDKDIIEHAKNISTDIGISNDDIDFLIDLLHTEANSKRASNNLTAALRLEEIATSLRKEI